VDGRVGHRRTRWGLRPVWGLRKDRCNSGKEQGKNKESLHDGSYLLK
jgi:hypothetical protein